MDYRTDSPWLDEMFTTTTALRGTSRTAFYRAVRRGTFVRLMEGVYLPASTWQQLGPDHRFLATIHAAALTSRSGLVFSHYSAAALWRLPIVGAWPDRSEATVGVESTGVSRTAFKARQYRLPEHTDRIDRLEVTPMPRTLIDIARVANLSVSVAMMDAALAPERGSAPLTRVDRAALFAEHSHIEGPRGRRRSFDSIALANGASGSPGESVSRVAMHVLGLPAPVLQQEFRDSRGLIGVVDFWWPQHSIIGEFDGFGKYLREELRGSRSIADVVMAEKVREDRLRAIGPRVVRWGWKTARSLPLLSRHLDALR